jgi:hypothetical protein
MNPMKTMLRIFACALFLALMGAATATAQTNMPVASDFGSELARDWSGLHLSLIRRTWGYSPPVASRALGYLGVTLYESVTPGMPDHQSLAGQLNGLGELPQPETGQSYHWAAAANSALATMTRLLFPTAHEQHQAQLEALYSQYNRAFEAEVDAETLARSEAFGTEIANAIFEWSMTDGGHEGYRRNFPADFALPEGDGIWQPTTRTKGNPQRAMQPRWGENRPFVLASGAECAPLPPPAYSEAPDSDFYREAQEVYDISRSLSDEQLEIARFWADDPFRTATPSGHSLAILTQVLAREDASLATAAEAYARMGIALADSFISCWHAKYEYNLLRPITYIQRVIDPTWMPVLTTPPFPEYPSGHSVESSAAAAVLSRMFGDAYAFEDATHEAWGLPNRSFASFADFAEEAALSRIYGGIHFRSAVEHGLAQGSCIAARVNAIAFLREG